MYRIIHIILIIDILKYILFNNWSYLPKLPISVKTIAHGAICCVNTNQKQLKNTSEYNSKVGKLVEQISFKKYFF